MTKNSRTPDVPDRRETALPRASGRGKQGVATSRPAARRVGAAEASRTPVKGQLPPKATQGAHSTAPNQPDAPRKPQSIKERILCAFDNFASVVTRWAGSPVAFGMAVASLVLWLIAGPIFKYSDGWQLVINTGTTIVTFLMVFLIQQSQNKDSAAVHLKLDELIASSKSANNQLLGIQDATEEELQKLADYYASLAKRVAADQGDGTPDDEADKFADNQLTDNELADDEPADEVADSTVAKDEAANGEQRKS